MNNSRKLYSSIGQIAPVYDFGLSLTGYKKSVEHFISELPFPEEANLKVLDAGCGTGLYSLAILQRYKNAQVTAFDLDEKLIQCCRDKVVKHGLQDRTYLFTADIQSSLKELQNQQFDLIVTAGVLEYVPLEKTIENLCRFLVPDGYFLSSPMRDTVLGRLVGKIYACKPYSRTENIQAFEARGFVLQKIIVPPWYKWASFKEVHFLKSSGLMK